jgi:hypothetical protein
LLNQIAAIHDGGAAAGGGTSYESIATVTVGSGGSSSIDFTSIVGTYKHLQIRGIARSTSAVTASNLRLRFNSDTGSNYAVHYLGGDGASAYAGASVSSTKGYAGLTSGASATSGIMGASVVDILDYSNTSKNKTIRALSGVDLNGSGYMELDSSFWNNTGAVTSISLFFDSGNLAQYSQFALYGIKG